MKKVLPIIVALLMAAVASLGIANWSKSQVVSSQGFEYVAAKQTLEPGTTIADANLTVGTVPLPTQNVQQGAVWKAVTQDFVQPINRASLVGRVVSAEIMTGYPVLEASLQPVEREQHRMDWRAKITANKRAVAIPVNAKSSVNGLVEVGDHVDVLVTINVPNDNSKTPQTTVDVPVPMGTGTQKISMPAGGAAKQGDPMTFYLLQDVEILSVGTKTFRAEDLDANDPLAAMAARQGAGGGVTVGLTPDQVLLLAFVSSAGNADFTLSLRSPDDPSLFDTTNKPPASFKSLLAFLGRPQ